MKSNPQARVFIKLARARFTIIGNQRLHDAPIAGPFGWCGVGVNY